MMESKIKGRRIIRTLDESHIPAYTSIAFNAYPSFKDFSPEAMADYNSEVARIMKNDPIVTFYGMFEGDELIAVMRLFDFQMNVFGKIVPVSGIGFLGVHLMHKKKGVARDMVAFYEEHYLKKSVPIATLLPFRPDFYKQMGYGHGTKMNQYRLTTGKIPAYAEAYSLRYLTKADHPELLNCHGRVVQKSHGRMMKFGDENRDLFGDAFNRVVGSFDESGRMNGYLVYKFQNGKAGNYTINQLYVKELVYENTAVLKTFLGYLRKQEDQVELVIFNTEDEHFHYLFANPLNDSKNYIPYGYLETNTQAIGVMYKLLDIKMAFEQCAHRRYNGVSLKLKLRVALPLPASEHRGMVPELSKAASTTTFVQIEEGQMTGLLEGDEAASMVADVTMTVGWSEFSALFMGCTSVKGLYDLGLLEVDNEGVLDALDLAFYYHQKPVCYTDF